VLEEGVGVGVDAGVGDGVGDGLITGVGAIVGVGVGTGTSGVFGAIAARRNKLEVKTIRKTTRTVVAIKITFLLFFSIVRRGT
jgi:hypothetical protein